MTAQKAADLIVKIRPASDQPYATMAGLRARSILLSSQPIDATHAESAGRWRHLLPASGSRGVRIEGEGVFADSKADMVLTQRFSSGEQAACQIIVPSFGAFLGDFMVIELAYLGHQEGEMQWRLVLNSTGLVTFEQAA